MKELNPKEACLLVVDVQEKLFPLIENPCEVLQKMLLLIKGARVLHVPILVSEQYPKGLGGTIEAITQTVGQEAEYFSKTTFSCLKDKAIHERFKELPYKQCILMGIEAHVCILQTARSLIQEGIEVIVANDAISSRSIYDFSTAIAELRDLGARISSTETILFELLVDSSKPEFKAISALIKS